MNGVCENVVPGDKTHDDRSVGDAFVKQVVPAITATPSYQAGKTLIVFTFDESNYLSTQAKGNWGIDCSNHTVYLANTQTCQVATILVSARIPAGATSAFYSHYSLGAAIEQNFGLPLLGHEASVTPHRSTSCDRRANARKAPRYLELSAVACSRRTRVRVPRSVSCLTITILAVSGGRSRPRRRRPSCGSTVG